MTKDLWRLGEQYQGTPLDPADCDPDPIIEFRRWFQVAVDAKLPTVNAVTLATVDERGRPVARIVLLTNIATNLGSRTWCVRSRFGRNRWREAEPGS